MSDTKLTVKLCYGEDILNLAELPSSVEALKAAAVAMFGTDAFKYQYYDEEGDLITIKTDGELTDAYEIIEMME